MNDQNLVSNPPLWLNVVPLGMEAGDADAAADAKFLAEKTPIDSIAYSMALFPEGRPTADKATPFAASFVRRRAAVAKAAPGLKQGILFQATMGHGWAPNTPAGGQLVVRRRLDRLQVLSPRAGLSRLHARTCLHACRDAPRLLHDRRRHPAQLLG